MRPDKSRRSDVICLSVGLFVIIRTDRDAVWHVDSGMPKEGRITWGAHWRHLTKTTEPSMCGGDAALCQNYFDHY